jgi:hypothetical protein
MEGIQLQVRSSERIGRRRRRHQSIDHGRHSTAGCAAASALDAVAADIRALIMEGIQLHNRQRHLKIGSHSLVQIVCV